MSRQMIMLQNYALELRKQLESKQNKLARFEQWDWVDPRTASKAINRIKKSIQHTLDVIKDIDQTIEQIKINQQYDKQRWIPQQ